MLGIADILAYTAETPRTVRTRDFQLTIDITERLGTGHICQLEITCILPLNGTSPLQGVSPYIYSP